MLTIMRQCVAGKTPVHSSKVKVTLKGQRSKVGSDFCVQSVTFSFLDGNYFAEDLGHSFKFKVTLRGQRSTVGSIFSVHNFVIP